MIFDLCIRFHLSGQSNYDAQRFLRGFPFVQLPIRKVRAFPTVFYGLCGCSFVADTFCDSVIQSVISDAHSLTRHLVQRRIMPRTSQLTLQIDGF